MGGLDMPRIINLTQHASTPEQVAAGVEDLPSEQREELSKLLTFDDIPNRKDLWKRAEQIVDYAKGFEYAMIGGAPYLVAKIEYVSVKAEICPMYAFTKRVSIENVQPDGSVIKTSIFRHEGFVEA